MKADGSDFICTCLEGYGGVDCSETPCDTGKFCIKGIIYFISDRRNTTRFALTTFGLPLYKIIAFKI